MLKFLKYNFCFFCPFFFVLMLEMTRMASELHTKMGKLKTRWMEEAKHNKTERLFAPKTDLSMLDYSKGNSGMKLIKFLRKLIFHFPGMRYFRVLQAFLMRIWKIFKNL